MHTGHKSEVDAQPASSSWCISPERWYLQDSPPAQVSLREPPGWQVSLKVGPQDKSFSSVLLWLQRQDRVEGGGGQESSVFSGKVRPI